MLSIKRDMKKRRLLKIVIWTTSILAIFIAVLVIHIYLATQKTDYPNKTLQLSRIDFKQPLNAAESAKIQAFVQQQPGVNHTMLNTDTGILIYTYANDQQTSLNVYNKLMGSGDYKAERFIARASDAASGCPIMTDKNSFNGKLVSYVSRLFN
jgi:hypothetical protein